MGSLSSTSSGGVNSSSGGGVGGGGVGGGGTGGVADGDGEVELRRGRRGRVVRSLGEGGFSTVLLVAVEESEVVAVKRVVVPTAEAEAEALREVRAHAVLGGDKPVSRHVVRLIETSMVVAGPGTGARTLQLVFPFYPHGDLTRRLLDASKPPLSETQALRILEGLTDALAAAHAAGVAHCDVKPQNVMLAEQDGSPVLIDWGSSQLAPLVFPLDSREAAEAVRERAEKHTSAAFRAPELWDPPRNKDFDVRKCDVFALGAVAWAMALEPLGYSPFESPTQGILTLAARSASFRVPDLRNCSDMYVAMVRTWLSAAPTDRPDAAAARDAVRRVLSDVDFDVSFPSGSS